LGAKPLQRLTVIRASVGLDQHRRVPIDAEPTQILFDARHELRAAAGLVEILDAQQEAAAAGARPGMPNDGAVGVAQVEPPGRRRREAGNDHRGCDRKDS
jgi:hypothetical protein